MDIFTIDTVGGSNAVNDNGQILYSSEHDKVEIFDNNSDQEEQSENEIDEDDDDTEYEYFGKTINFLACVLAL